LLPSGQVLVAGGSPGQTVNAALASAELYTADRLFADGVDGTPLPYP